MKDLKELAELLSASSGCIAFASFGYALGVLGAIVLPSPVATPEQEGLIVAVIAGLLYKVFFRSSEEFSEKLQQCFANALTQFMTNQISQKEHDEMRKRCIEKYTA